jgi:hypothetical protein
MEPEVSLTKFKEEIGNFHKISNAWREKGVFLIHEDYPIVEFMFTTPKLRPSAIAFCVRIDFTNYDIEPPSLKFICPFTKKILTRQEVPLRFFQINMPDKVNQNIQNEIQAQDLLQGDEVPFLCIPGIKEYHDHPAHTGDSWLLHRTKGEGSLGFILDQLYDHSIAGIASISSYNISYNIGFAQPIQIPKIQMPII